MIPPGSPRYGNWSDEDSMSFPKKKRQSYRIKECGTNSGDQHVGTIVYDPSGHDYGLASDDTRMSGRKHVSVTLSPDGDYPTFTVLESSLEKLT